jgi:hypothetical protein
MYLPTADETLSAHDQRVLDIPRIGGTRYIQSRISDLVAWAKTTFPPIHQSIRDTQEQLHTGHQDIPTHFSNTTAVPPTTTTTPTATTAQTTNNTVLPHTLPSQLLLLAIRQRLRHTRTQIAKISSDV